MIGAMPLSMPFTQILLNISHACQVPNPSLTGLTLISNFTKKTQEDQSHLCEFLQGPSLSLPKSST